MSTLAFFGVIFYQLYVATVSFNSLFLSKELTLQKLGLFIAQILLFFMIIGGARGTLEDLNYLARGQETVAEIISIKTRDKAVSTAYCTAFYKYGEGQEGHISFKDFVECNNYRAGQKIKVQYIADAHIIRSRISRPITDATLVLPFALGCFIFATRRRKFLMLLESSGKKADIKSWQISPSFHLLYVLHKYRFISHVWAQYKYEVNGIEYSGKQLIKRPLSESPMVVIYAADAPQKSILTHPL